MHLDTIAGPTNLLPGIATNDGERITMRLAPKERDGRRILMSVRSADGAYITVGLSRSQALEFSDVLRHAADARVAQ